MTETIYESPRPVDRDGETVITSTCGGRCVVNAHVREGRIVHVSTDARRWNPTRPPLPACARGVGQIERVYHPDRLKYPMRRAGPRGSGQYRRVSWDEALDEVARELLRVRASHGNAAILDASRTGSLSMLHGRVTAQRFLNMFGGCTELWSNMSAEAEVFAVRTTFGTNVGYEEAGREPTGLCEFAAHCDVGLEPGRRHLWHRHNAVPKTREAAGHAHHLRGSAPDHDQSAARG
jgi:anaerobic dimethyl sulfoxide reductase subunit A